MAAQAVGRTQSPLGLFYRRIEGRMGAAGGVTATAHKLARLVYQMLRHGTEYVKRSMAEYEARLRAQLERHLRAKAARLGFELVPRGAAAGPWSRGDRGPSTPGGRPGEGAVRAGRRGAGGGRAGGGAGGGGL